VGGAVWLVAQASSGAWAAAQVGAPTAPDRIDSTHDTTDGTSHERCSAQSLGGQWVHSSEEDCSPLAGAP
jgi:hypothetical protein